MPALNFISRFAAPVEKGEKRQTIRLLRKHPIKAGDRLYLYTGQRTKRCRKLREVTCKSVQPIKITPGLRSVVLDERRLTYRPASRVAHKDGFSCLGEMMDFFRRVYGRTFDGVLIRW